MNRSNSRRRGGTTGWIIVLLLLAALVAFVGYRIATRQADVDYKNLPTTQPD